MFKLYMPDTSLCSKIDIDISAQSSPKRATSIQIIGCILHQMEVQLQN